MGFSNGVWVPGGGTTDSGSFTGALIKGPKYTPPKMDEAKMRAYQQEALAPGVSLLRRRMREVQAGRYASPTARAAALRGAARGGGEALAPLQASALKTAMTRIMPEYRAEVRAGEINFNQAQIDKVAADKAAADKAADRVAVGVNAAGQPIYMTQDKARAYFASLADERGTPSQVTGLTAASRRPITDTVSAPSPLETPYSTDDGDSNWAYV